MPLTPVKRSYNEGPRKGPKDVDAAARARKMQALGWALYGGIPMGGAAGFMLGHPILGALLGPAIIFSVAMTISAGAGKGAGVLYMPSGSSTPKQKEYSRAESLVVRGEYDDAIRAFEVEILENPKEPEPYFRIARIHRDRLNQHQEAVAWFKRGAREAELSGGQEIRTWREISEIYLHHLREPRRAAPELARLIEKHGGTPDGEWAKSELALIKEELAREE